MKPYNCLSNLPIRLVLILLVENIKIEYCTATLNEIRFDKYILSPFLKLKSIGNRLFIIVSLRLSTTCEQVHLKDIFGCKLKIVFKLEQIYTECCQTTGGILCQTYM